MNNQQAYNRWAEQYDTNKNLTRDLEGKALKEVLKNYSFLNVLEIGCGTGKNTAWLITKANRVTGVDFSEEMLAKAKEKINHPKIEFIQADITKAWNFTNDQYELISFSLVLEHIKELDFIFEQARKKITKGGHLYLGELHPYKQYTGSLARFDTEEGTHHLQCYPHHISAFLQEAIANDFAVVEMKEWFDNDNQDELPRILTLLFKAI